MGVDFLSYYKIRASSNSATPEMERTKGLRLVVMQEPEANESINIGLMKELTGNDKIQARDLFKEPIEFVLNSNCFYV